MIDTSKRMQKPALIIFDWDDTLVDNYAAIHTAINAARAHFGQPIWDLAETRLQCRRALHEIFPEWFGADWPIAKKIFYDSFAAEHIACLRVKPGAQQLLDEIFRSRTPMAVNSNKNKDYLRQEISHLNWGHYFSVLVGAGDVQRGKPDPEGINHIRQVLHIPSQTQPWFVGDNDIDAQTARSGGCLPILLHQKPIANVDQANKVLLGNCMDLLELFKSVA